MIQQFFGEVSDAIRAQYGPLMEEVNEYLLEQCYEELAGGSKLGELIGIVLRDEEDVMAVVSKRTDLTPDLLEDNQAIQFALAKDPLPGFLTVAAFYEDEEHISQAVFSMAVSMTPGGQA